MDNGKPALPGPAGLTVGTWNLERPAASSWKIVPRQRQRLESLEVDIWVLTETRASIGPGDGWHAVHTEPLAGWSRDDDERMISIWARWPLELSPVDHDPRTHVSAGVDHPEGRLLVCGVVIPWANDKGPDGTASMWQRHAETIPELGRVWRRLRDMYEGTPLVVAGDFNQDQDGSGWYGTHHVRTLLTDELHRSGLHLLSGDDVVAAGLLEEQHLVDHIAVSPPLPDKGWTLRAISTRDEEGVRLSDHATVMVSNERVRWPLPLAEDLDWEPVLAFLPAMTDDDFDPGSWVKPRELSPNVFHVGYPALSDLAIGLMETMYEQQVIAGFDWPQWFNDVGVDLLEGEPDTLDTASLEDCRRLLTAILRSDRFDEGYYLKHLETGAIPRILRRVREHLSEAS